METSNHGYINILDQVRLTYGIDRMKVFFANLLKIEHEKAINLINDDNLHFCTLFSLQSEIIQNRLLNDLNPIYRNALNIINSISTRKSTRTRNSAIDYSQLSYSSMKWILDTGNIDEGYSNHYDEILDCAAALLIKTFEDKTALPIVADMIFKRHREGLFNYDLIWAFFEAHDPDSLTFIAKRLCSENIKDVELACKLLSFIPYTNIGVTHDNSKLYILCQEWLKQNLPYLYYTGDSFQQTFNPLRYLVSWEAKYLCKAISAANGEFLEPLTEVEERLLDNFRAQSFNIKIVLTDYSFKLHQQDRNLWNLWLSYPVTSQITIAQKQVDKSVQ